MAAMPAPVLPVVDPLAPYLGDQPPEILRDLPTTAPVPAGVTFRQVVIRSRGPSEIYAVIAAPTTPGPHPGLLVLHGGGGTAEVEKALAWAERGYVAVALDEPGIAEPTKLTLSTGPWSSFTYGDHRWTANPEDSVIFDAVVAGLQGLALLRAQPGVDRARIGVVGISWGGYLTTMVCSLAGDRVRAGFSVFGCGFYDRTSSWSNMVARSAAEQEAWLRVLDPGRRASGMTAAFFIAGAANDFFYYPQAVQATLDALPGEKNHLYAPNANHQVPLPGGMAPPTVRPEDFVPTPFQPHPTPGGTRTNWLAMEVPYFAYHLKGEGQPLPKVTVVPTADPRQVAVTVTTPHSLNAVTVAWAAADPDVKTRLWTSVPTTRDSEGRYRATLPETATTWFAIASDERPVTVSSDLVTIAS